MMQSFFPTSHYSSEQNRMRAQLAYIFALLSLVVVLFFTYFAPADGTVWILASLQNGTFLNQWWVHALLILACTAIVLVRVGRLDAAIPVLILATFGAHIFDSLSSFYDAPIDSVLLVLLLTGASLLVSPRQFALIAIIMIAFYGINTMLANTLSEHLVIMAALAILSLMIYTLQRTLTAPASAQPPRLTQIHSSITQQIAAGTALQQVLDHALAGIVEHDPRIQQAQLFLTEQDAQMPRLTAHAGSAASADTPAAVSTATAQKRAVIAPDTGLGIEMALPLRIGEQVIGALDVRSSMPHALTADDLPAYQMLADQLALAIYHARQREQSEQQVRQLQHDLDASLRKKQRTQEIVKLADGDPAAPETKDALQETAILYGATKALLETNNPTEILDVIVNYLIDGRITQVFIALLNKESWDAPNAAVEIVAYWHEESDVDLLSVVLSPEQFPAWRQLSSRDVLTIPDLRLADDLDDLEKISIESLGARSLVIIPLRVSNRDLGAIWLGSHDPHVYSERNLRIYQAFAEQTSLTLEAARLLKQTDQRARQLQTSATISQSVSQILDLDVLLSQVVDLIREQFKYDHVQVFLMDEANEYATLHASTGEAGKKLLAIGHKLQKGSKSVIGAVTANGIPAIALDTAAANVVHKPNPYLPLTRSEMALPLTIKGEVVGALDVQSNQPNAFTDEDIQALTTLAAQIAVAIDNARLYAESRRRADEMGFMFEIITAAAAAETLEEVLQGVASDIKRALRVETVVIYLPREYEDFRGNRKWMMEVSALASESEGQVMQTESVELGDAGNLIGLVAGGMQSQIVASVEREVRYPAISREARSAAIVPITSGTQLSGVIVLENRALNAFDHDSLTLMLTLAGSLYAIIQNMLLLDRLRQTNEQLREVDRLKSQFLASMSHELRTPLNSIIGFSRVMLKGIDGPLTEMQEQDLNTIYNSGNHLLTLINDILDQAKIEANELNLKFSYFDIKPMVESVKSIAIGMLKEKPLTLQVEIAPNMPQAYGDEFRSRQILLNLVSNAIKFTPEGGISIRIYAVDGEQGVMVRLDVVDTGIGIAEKDMPILFEQFRQVDNSLTRTAGGTGLGLPISKSLVEMQGGKLLVQSKVGTGSVFSVLIPTYPGAEDELERQREARRSGRKDAESPRRVESSASLIQGRSILESLEEEIDDEDTQQFAVLKPENMPQPDMTVSLPPLNQKREALLIEDNKEMVDQFRRLLQREGFEVQTADHPSYAEAMVGQLRPNVVLLDVNFAGGSGWQVLKNLKERDDTFDIPIVVTTTSDEAERAYQLGAHTFMQRPVLPDDLIRVILTAERESQRERIVIIDDQPEAIRLLTQLLSEQAEFRVYAAQTGDEGVSLVARRHPDLVILDLRMPGKDGFAVLDELRDNPETARIPVLVVTGDLDLSTSEREQLANIHVLPKAGISQEQYDGFIENVRSYLASSSRK